MYSYGPRPPESVTVTVVESPWQIRLERSAVAEAVNEVATTVAPPRAHTTDTTVKRYLSIKLFMPICAM
jgi:hypothetical protein